MSAQNSPSQHTATGSQAALKTTFRTYEEYAEQASQMWQEVPRSRDKELWLAQFPANGQPMQWYSLSDDPKLSPDQFEDAGKGLRRTRSKKLFRGQLQAPEHPVTCQILIFVCQYDYLVAESEVETWHDEPLDWFIEVVGLALDMPLNIWDHMRSRLEGKRSYSSPLPVPWVENCSMLDIGQCSIVALENSSQSMPSTAVMIMPQSLYNKEFDHMDRRVKTPIQVGRPHFTSLPYDTPSAMTQRDPSNVWQSAEREPRELRYVRQSIERSLPLQNPSELTTCLFACFKALLDLHLCTPSRNIPFLQYAKGFQDLLALKHYQWPQEDRPPDRTWNVYVKDRDLWLRLREEIVADSLSLDNARQFASNHLEGLNDGHKKDLADLLSRFEKRLAYFQLIESSLKDLIASRSDDLSTQMAVQSIRESKRVILLTALAFVFLPISLASSIYGMNVQQINDTGHSISAFVITAVALCVTTALALVAITRLIAYRARMMNALYRHTELIGLILGLSGFPLECFSWLLEQAVKIIKAPYQAYITIRSMVRSRRQPKQQANPTSASVA